MSIRTNYWANGANDLALFLVNDVMYPQIYHFEHFARFKPEDMGKLEKELVEKLSIIIDSEFFNFDAPEEIERCNIMLIANIFDDKEDMEHYLQKVSESSIMTSTSELNINKKVNANVHIAVHKKKLFRTRHTLYVTLLIT